MYLKVPHNFSDRFLKRLPAADFHESYFQSSCAVIISLKEDEDNFNEFYGKTRFDVNATFTANDTCRESLTLNLAPDEKMCSTELHRANITITKCCTGNDFCNFELRPPKYSYNIDISVSELLINSLLSL